MRRALAVALALAASLALGGIGALIPGAARADGDPASDTLIGLDSFLPFTPPVPPVLTRELNATLKAARRKGKPIKVAVVSSAPDLGSVSSLFGQPQKYAEFLSREDAFAVKDPILVVMAKGFGFARTGTPLDLGFTKDVSLPSGASSKELAQAALDAAARYSGVKAAGASGSSGGGGSSGFVVAAVIVVALALLGGGVAMLLRARRATAPKP